MSEIKELLEDYMDELNEVVKKRLQDSEIFIPPCLHKFKESPVSFLTSSRENALQALSYLRTMYPSFYKENAEQLVRLANINTQLRLDEVGRWTCNASCDDATMKECTASLSWAERIMFSLQSVRKVAYANGSHKCELIFTGGKSFIFDPSSETLTRDLVSFLFSAFGRLYVIDLRTKKDKERLQRLYDFISSSISEEVSIEDTEEDESTLQLKENILRILMNLPLTKDREVFKHPEDAYCALYDGKFAYFPRDALIKILSSTYGVNVSVKKLSKVVKNSGIIPSRLRVEDVRVTFYRFKPSKKQIDELMGKESKREEVSEDGNV